MHARVFFVGLLVTVFAFHSGCRPQGSSTPAELPAGKVLPMRHARTLTVVEHNGFHVVDLKAAISGWGKAASGPEQRARLVLVPEGQLAPELTGELLGATLIRTPVQRIAVNYVPFEAMLSALGVADRLVAVVGTFSYDDAVYQRVRSGELRQVGYGWHSPPQLDALVRAQPGAFLMALGDIAHADSLPRIAALNIPVVPMFMDAETTYLGRVEYLRLVGLLVGKLTEADAYLAQVEAEVARLKVVASVQPRQRLLWAWFNGGDKWAVTVRNADAQLLRDANVELVMGEADDPRQDVFSWVSTEQLLRKAADVDVWIFRDSHSTPFSDFGLLRHFKAWREGRTYAADQQKKAERNAYEFYEIGAIRPDYLLGDIIKAVHPQIRPEPFRYLRRESQPAQP